MVFDLDVEVAFLLTTNAGSGGVLFFVLCHLEKYQKEAFEAANIRSIMFYLQFVSNYSSYILQYGFKVVEMYTLQFPHGSRQKLVCEGKDLFKAW